MKKLVFFLILFSILFSAGQKPWDYLYWANENPNIISFGTFEIWNTEKMHYSLESLQLDCLISKKEPFIEMQTQYDLAKRSKTHCSYIGDKAFSINMIIDPAGIILDLAYKQVTQETITECLNYPKYWRKTMDLAVDYIAQQENEIEDKCELATAAYFKLEFSGLCDYSKELCKKTNSIQTNCKKTKYYGDFEIIYEMLDYSDNVQVQIKEPTPDMKGFDVFANSMDSGVLNEISIATDDATNICDSMENQYFLLESDVKTKQKKSKDKYAELKKQKINLITGGSKIENYLGGQLSDLSADFEAIGYELMDADSDYDSAAINFKSKTRNYLKNSLEQMEELTIQYSTIFSNAEKLNSQAEEITYLKRDEAQQTIETFIKNNEAQFLDKYSQDYLKDAQENFQKGENSNIYGEKYQYYRDSISNINSISQDADDGKTELLFFSELSELKILIQNSENDGINVEYEKTILLYLEKNPNKLMLSEIEGLKERIIEKLELKYSYLEERRNYIKTLASIIQDENGYFFSLLNENEKGIFTKDKIDYPAAAGKLKALEKLYAEIENEINYEIEKSLPGKLLSETSFFIGDCRIGEKCSLQIDILVTNPFKISIKKPVVEIQLPLETMLYKKDISLGIENIEELIVEKLKLTMYLKSIDAGSTNYFLLSKNETIVSVEKLVFESRGNPDGTGTFSYIYSLKSIFEINGLILPDYPGKIAFVKLNGVEQKIKNNALQSGISKGANTLEIETMANDAFSFQKTQIQASSIGLNKKISYIIEVIPKEQLSYLSLILYDGISTKVSGLTILSNSGHQLRNKKTGEFGEISFEILNLQKNETAKIRVEYIVSDPVGYLEEEIKKLELNDLSEKDKDLIEDIKNEVSQNNTDLAIEKIKELENQINKEKNEEYKMKLDFEDEFGEIEKELSKLENALKYLEDDEVAQRLNARKELLEKTLSENSNPNQDSLDNLKKIDDKWLEKETNQLVKDLYSSYNLVKKDLISLDLYEETKTSLAEIENLLNLMEVQNDIDYYPQISKKINDLQNRVALEKGLSKERIEAKKTELSSVSMQLSSSLDIYELQYDDSKGSEFEYLFSLPPKDIKSKIDDYNKQIDKYSEKELQLKKEDLEKTLLSVDSINNYLKRESQARLNDVLILCSGNAADQNICSNQKTIEQAEKLINESRYLKAISIINTLYISPAKIENDDNSLLLGITLLLIISLLAYLLKDHIKIPQFKKTEPKKLKKHDEQN
ncbi:MAG: hypothetical protein WC501_05340 [Candidatus Micrarchaeia archaeon]